MVIHGLNKLTLLDYPHHTACTVFVGGCNFRCPFCHNASLVLRPNTQPVIKEEEFFEYLDKRKGLIEGVCITGGEPTLYSELPEFIKKIKERGFLVKLDTNGTNPDMLAQLIETKSIDYIAMDIKNSLDSYGKTVGVPNFDTTSIKRSVKIIMENGVDYEFRTTVVKEFHNDNNFLEISKWLKGAKRYVLQNFRDGEDLIMSGLGNHTDEKIRHFCGLLTPFIDKVSIRGEN